MAELTDPRAAPGRAAAHVMYALYAIALFTALPLLAGVIVAYVGRGSADALYRSHLSWGIRTFWWALLWLVIGTILTLVLIGYAILAILWLWTAYRTIRGWLRLADGLAMG
jgi:uncharacterized membrane protein